MMRTIISHGASSEEKAPPKQSNDPALSRQSGQANLLTARHKSLHQPQNIFLDAEWSNRPDSLLYTPNSRNRQSPAQPKDYLLDVDMNGNTELRQRRHRILGGNSQDNAFQSVFVAPDGTAYEPYSLAWRYLGLYIDCDIDEEEEEEAEEKNGDRRQRQRHLSKDDKEECNRKLLWAAYLDTGYRGGAIGEYQFLDRETEEWNTTTCQTKRCARMDCHDPHSKFKLLGVYKETEGLLDWAEQLFKHHAYCQWDSDTYETMQNYRERWPSDCTELYSTDSDGNTLYAGLRPMAEGNMTIGVYWDDQCLTDSGLTWAEYVVIYYSSYYYGNSETGRKVAAKWETAISTWNEAMEVYKTCQPCRSYSLNPNQQQSSHDSKEGRDRDRFLGEDNEGEGEAEPWGYDCNDDAGYLNCDQCYKFETKTDMEAADEADLARASKQGTILHIKVNGTHYGTGGYESFYLGPEVVAERAAAFLAIVISCLVFMYLIRRYCMFKCEKSPRREVVRDGYKAHTDDAAAPKKNSLSNKLEALACTCDVGPISTEIRVLLQKPPMHRE